jgi:hypothetical protein
MEPKTPLQLIREFCKSHTSDPLHEKLLLHNYYDEFMIAISRYPAEEQTDEKKETISKTLLSDNSLSKNLKLVQSELEDYKNVLRGQIDKSYKTISFWKSVWSSIVASFIFSLLLIVLLAIANNQVKDIVDKFIGNHKLENNVNQK